MLDRRHLAIARAASAALGALVIGCACVSSCTSTPDPDWTYPVQDQRGRRCEFDCGVTDCVLTCDQPSGPDVPACSAGTTACLTLAPGADPRLAGAGVADPAAEQLCAGCCGADGLPAGALADCAPVVCSSDSDCYGEGYFCISGVCACASSICGSADGGSADGGSSDGGSSDGGSSDGGSSGDAGADAGAADARAEEAAAMDAAAEAADEAAALDAAAEAAEGDAAMDAAAEAADAGADDGADAAGDDASDAGGGDDAGGS